MKRVWRIILIHFVERFIFFLSSCPNILLYFIINIVKYECKGSSLKLSNTLLDLKFIIYVIMLKMTKISILYFFLSAMNNEITSMNVIFLSMRIFNLFAFYLKLSRKIRANKNLLEILKISFGIRLIPNDT